MNIRLKTGAFVVVFLIVLLLFDSNIHAQNYVSLLYPPETESDHEMAKEDALSTSAAETLSAQTANPAETPEPDLWHQESLTGDWGGTRTKWEEKGFDLEVALNQFYQGVADGGTRTGSEYNGTFATTLNFDLGKMFGWEYWLTEFQTVTRFGGPALGGVGSLTIVNTDVVIPAADDTVFAITALNFTKLFPINLKEGKLIALSFGRFNLVDLIDEHFFAGGGTERFFNIAQIGPLTVLRQVPLITNVVSFAYIRAGEPFFTFAILDPNDHSTTSGLSDLFADGVTFSPGINFPTKYFGKSGKHTFGGAITTKAYSPFDAIRQGIIPGPPIHPVEPKRGSYSINYVFRQYIVERAKNDGWGFFTQFSFADEDMSPIRIFFDAGLGGNGLFENRPLDEFGISYAYTDLSEVLKDNLDLLPFNDRRLRAEHQLELFYNFHFTPWLKLTGDLQIIRPNLPIADTAIVPGARLEIVF
ncbi:carbohydrate porin [bacterium]|nr:carbohydrate porin [bacterium]